MREYTEQLGLVLGVRGLMNVQFALKDEVVYVLEVNPRASRTVPYASKATGLNLAYAAAQVMVGVRLADIPEAREKDIDYFAVKESVLPFSKFPGADTVLGPEMKSTGEVMGIDKNFGMAFAKSQEAAGSILPRSGTVFISVKNSMRRNIIFMAKKIADMGFKICASEGTSKVLRSNGVNAKMIPKIGEGKPDIIDFSNSGYGRNGPLHERPAYAEIVDAFTKTGSARPGFSRSPTLSSLPPRKISFRKKRMPSCSA